MAKNDILIIGTGYFAEIMIGDLAATARRPVTVVIGGRNAERLDWLKEAGNARAAIFGAPARFETARLDATSSETVGEGIAAVDPAIVVQSASLQSPWKVDTLDSKWSKLVADAGFGMTIAFHATLPARSAAAVSRMAGARTFVNTCYPDGVNQVLHKAGLPITCGVGNIGIFSSIIQALVPFEKRGDVRVLGHHQHLVQWRKPGAERTGAPVRAWIGDAEIADVDGLTRHVKLPYRELNAISGAAAVPVLLALAGHGEILAHVPGPGGLPGGYPVRVDTGTVTLDLPAGITREDAVAWNRSFEAADGVSVTEDGRVTYSEQARTALAAYSPELAKGFHVTEVEEAAQALGDLRARLGG
ncbi:MAG: hypothetical protein AB1698_03930 [Pseudomonadota bacterium]